MLRVRTSNLISWYCAHDKIKKHVYTQKRWAIISAIVKSAPSRKKTRDRIARIAFPAFHPEFSNCAYHCFLLTKFQENLKEDIKKLEKLKIQRLVDFLKIWKTRILSSSFKEEEHKKNIKIYVPTDK